MTTIRDLLRSRIDSAINSTPQGAWKVLVTDKHSQELLDAVYTNYEVLQKNVTSVEELHSARPPRQVEGVYLLTPTNQNINRVIADFEGNRGTYRSAFVFFLETIDDNLAKRLVESLKPYNVLKSFTELNCNFLPVEDRVFSLKTPSAFFSMFGNPGGMAVADLAMEAFYDDLKVASQTIVNLLATTFDNPYIRYYQPSNHGPLGPLSVKDPGNQNESHHQEAPQTSRWRAAMGIDQTNEYSGDGLSKTLALQVQEDLERFIQSQNGPPDDGGHSRNEFLEKSRSHPRATLFITDRSMDPMAPLLHEFWYQAMINDLLPLEDGRKYLYTYENTKGEKEDKVVELSEDDPVWLAVRHLHMQEALHRIPEESAAFLRENSAFSGQGQNVSINDLKDMMANLPHFQTQRDQLGVHMTMAQECMDIFVKRHLDKLAHVEQCAATGFNPDGRSSTTQSIVGDMMPIFHDSETKSLDKVRIIALYIISRREGIADEDRRRLFQHARLSISEQDMVNNLVNLGVKVIKDGKSSRGPRLKQKYDENRINVSRYDPILKLMLEESANNKLDQTMFPFLGDLPSELSASLRTGGQPTQVASGGSLRTGSNRHWTKGTTPQQRRDVNRPRYFVFVAGGITYSEIRQAYVLSDILKKDIILGSTHIITPQTFMKDLRPLSRGGIGGDPPTGLPVHEQNPGRPPHRAPGQPAPYQLILDFRHWVPPVPPPVIAPPSTNPAGGHSGSTLRPNIAQTERAMSQMSMDSTHSKSSRFGRKDKSDKSADGEDKKKKRNIFKMRWD